MKYIIYAELGYIMMVIGYGIGMWDRERIYKWGEKRELEPFDWVQARELLEAGAFRMIIGIFIGAAVATCAFLYAM